jgi:hypothetical protein
MMPLPTTLLTSALRAAKCCRRRCCRRPVIYHLHGGGECEGQQGFGPLTRNGVNLLSAVKAHGLPAIVEEHAPPCIVVSPQCPQRSGGGRGWGTAAALDALEQLAEAVSAALRVDAGRQVSQNG